MHCLFVFLDLFREPHLPNTLQSINNYPFAKRQNYGGGRFYPGQIAILRCPLVGIGSQITIE